LTGEFGLTHDDIERARDQRDRRKILVRIVGQLRIQARIDRIGEGSHQQRVAIRIAGRDRLGADDGPGPRLVLDHDGDAEIPRHLLCQRARNHVGAAARRKRHHNPDDPVRIKRRGGAVRK
jgi:hypothetical protein